jgi:uncharacterized membrane protein
MEELFHSIAHTIAVVIEAFAVVIIVVGVLEAIIGLVRLVIKPDATNDDRRMVWLVFARWLIAGLTFQLAADLVNTSFEPTWDQVGRLAAIAGIRTFLSYFLDHELDDTWRRQHKRDPA